ncbi:MAG: HAD-IB family hydrolase [Deltaproteobacteria bacterium]|nr:HAD-IB family hydrolase [Deltaproteobacteria bacterium]
MGGTTGAGRPAAFFDLDGTLLSVNSGRLWLDRERRHGRVSALQTARAVGFLVGYHFGVVDIVDAMRQALQTIQGEREETLREWTRVWFESEVVPRHEAPGARPAVEAHRARGHALVLLTSSSPYESELATRYFGLDGFRCTRYELGPDGRFTGDLVLPLCYGEGKVHHAEAYAADHGLDLDRSYFYTDSNTDLPMLRRVPHPRVVKPDIRLRWEARRRGWPILDWSRADEPVLLARG